LSLLATRFACNFRGLLVIRRDQFIVRSISGDQSRHAPTFNRLVTAVAARATVRKPAAHKVPVPAVAAVYIQAHSAVLQAL